MRLLNPIKTTRRAMQKLRTHKERAKILRQYFPDEFSSGKGFDLRSPKKWTAGEKTKVTRRFANIDKIIDKREREIYDRNLMNERVKKIRPYFGDTFSASEGYDLRDIDEWHPSKKKKAEHYFLAMAPELMTEKKVVKRPKTKKKLEQYIMRSDQTELLPGQTAAVFHVEKGRDLEVDMKPDGTVGYVLDDVVENEFKFNIAALATNANKEIARVLAQTDANLFRVKLIVGQAYNVLDRSEIAAEIKAYMKEYKRARPKDKKEKWDQFLRGIVAYPGETRRYVTGEAEAQREEVSERRHERDLKRAKTRKKFTVKEAKLGRKLSTAEKVTGRRGRK